MPESSMQKALKEPEKIPWHPLHFYPIRLVITADKPKAEFTVENRSDSDVTVVFTFPTGKMELVVAEFSRETTIWKKAGVGSMNSKIVLPYEVLEVQVTLTPSELEKLKKEGLKDEEIQMKYTSEVRGQTKEQVKLIKVVFSDKKLTKEEEEWEKKVYEVEDEQSWLEKKGFYKESPDSDKSKCCHEPWTTLGIRRCKCGIQRHDKDDSYFALKIEPQRLVIRGDKAKAVFKVENLSGADRKVFISVPKGNMEIAFGDGSKSKPEEPKTVLARESVKVHVNLTSSGLEKLKTEGLKDEMIRVECEPVESSRKTVEKQVEKVIVAFSDKELTKEEKEAEDQWKKKEAEEEKLKKEREKERKERDEKYEKECEEREKKQKKKKCVIM